MRPIDEAITLAVEHHAAGIVVVRVAGEPSRVTARRLARLLDAHTSAGSRRCATPSRAPGAAR